MQNRTDSPTKSAQIETYCPHSWGSRRFAIISATLIWCTLAAAHPQTTVADVVYTYTGNNYTEINDNNPPTGTFTTDMSITGSFTVTSAFGANLMNQAFIPNSFSFSNGRNTITNVPSLSIESFSVSTNSLGEITNWHIDLLTPLALSTQFGITTSNSTFFGVFDQGAFIGGGSSDTGRNMSPGTWAMMSTSVPEPSAMLLLTLMIVMLVSRRFVMG